MELCTATVCTDKRKVEEKETTQLKLLEGKGRANPWLSTLLSLQTSEPFANAPLHFYFASLFTGTPRCSCFHLNPWQTAASGSAVMVSRETAKATLLDVQGYNALRPISAPRHKPLSPLSSKLLLEPVFTTSSQAVRSEDAVPTPRWVCE